MCGGRTSTYFAHVFSIMEGFERRWLQFFLSLGQTCKPDTTMNSVQDSITVLYSLWSVKCKCLLLKLAKVQTTGDEND